MSLAAPSVLLDGDEALCADDWVFLAEGAFHAVLAYRRARPHARFSGRVLRIAKHTGALAQHASASLSELIAAFVGDQSIVLRGTRCRVPTALLAHALGAAELTGARSPKRIADCAAAALAIEAANPSSMRVASLLADLTAAATSADLGFAVDGGAVGLSPSVFIELKPKCGVLPISPFIASQHLADNERHIVAKSVYCRFAMHQLSKHSGQAPAAVSNYCPLDLCSAESTRVKTALRDLLRSPQNNIRISIRTGAAVQNIDLVDSRVGEVVGSHFANQPMSLPIAIALVEAWCCHPALGVRAFASLRSLQRLDAWDIEVAALLPPLIASARARDGVAVSDSTSYPELTADQSSQWLSDMAECAAVEGAYQAQERCGCHAGASRHRVGLHSSVDSRIAGVSLCWVAFASVGLTAGGKAAVAELARDLRSQPPCDPSSSSEPPQTASDAAMADWTWRPSSNMRKAVELLGSLAPHDLTMILFNFLVATMAKDLSIIFSVAALPSSHSSVGAACQLPQVTVANVNGDVEAQCLTACTRQSACGIFSVASPSAGDSRTPLNLFSVRAALVDLDCKPVAKLPAYERMDRDIVLHFLQQTGL